MPDGSFPARRALALIGNTVALALLGLLLLQGPRLFGEDERRRASATAGRASVERAGEGPVTRSVDGKAGVARATEGSSAVEGDGRALLLIVVDALRDDTSRDAALMPNLAALSARGERTTWWVDLLVPSTIGAIELIVEGRSSPPVRALQDFGARPAASGGWLEAIRDRGEGVFVAGPDLWTERYGAWIDGARVEAGMPDRVSDMRLTLAGLEALAIGSEAAQAPRLVVVHLGELDATAHRHGADGAHWRQAARRVDARLGTLVDAAGGRSIVVLADHGVTARGGHAGGEAVVRRAPLVVAATPAATEAVAVAVAVALDRTVRPDAVVRAVLGEPGAGAEHARDDATSVVPVAEGGASAVRAPGAIAAVVGPLVLLGGAFVTVAGIGFAARGARSGFVASAAFWIAVALAFAGREEVGTAVVLATLVGLAALVLARWRREVDARAVRGPSAAAFAPPPPVPSLLAGVAIAIVAVAAAVSSADASLPTIGPPAVAAYVPLLVAAVAGLLGGAGVAHLRSPAAAGTALAVVVAAAVHLGGETTSLSSVDVRLAHRAAGLAPGGPGIALATPVALLRLACPFAAVLLGYLLARRRLARPVGTPERLSFARAFGACQLGSAAVYALCFVQEIDTGSTIALPLAAAGFGGLLREGVTVCLVFATLVFTAPRAAAGADGRRRVAPAGTEAGGTS